MKLLLKNCPNKKAIENLLQKNNITDYKVREKNSCIELNIKESKLGNDEIDILKRHFSFYDIFYWSEKGVENITLWEKPARIKGVLLEFDKLYGKIDYDIFTSVEAKGFILGGIFAQKYKKPFIPLRKFKPLYEKLPGYKHQFKNWKKQKESLYIFKHSIKGHKAMFLDDILQTGNSLKACERMLAKFNIDIVGAFYLLDTATKKIRKNFSFPNRSLLRYNDFFNNKILT